MVSIQESSMNTVTETYKVSNDLTEIKSDSKIYFVEENPTTNGTYTIYFGDGVLGHYPIDGNIVKISYLDTAGYFANKANSFTLADSIDGFSANVIIKPVQSSVGGSEKENVEKIRFRAPNFYTTQNRMVTKNDYISLLSKDYPNIQSISVWGGEENVPVVYGKIFISLNPVDNYSLSTLEKERIKSDIIKNRSVLTVTPELVDPDFVYLLLNTTVDYDSKKTSLTKNDIETLIRTVIFDFKTEFFDQFNTTFRLSRLETNMLNSDKSIVSAETKLYLQKRIKLSLNETKNYTINFGIPLHKGSVNEGLFSYPLLSQYDATGVLRECHFEEVPQSFTGIDKIEVLDSGSGYETTPEILISGDGAGATATAKVVNGKITEITITNRGSGYSMATIEFSSGNAIANAVLESNNGDLRCFYYKTNGEKVIMHENGGTIKYKEGEIILLDLTVISVAENDTYDENILTINILPDTRNISPKRNQILTLDTNDSFSIKTTANEI
jgi:hypothetical protein